MVSVLVSLVAGSRVPKVHKDAFIYFLCFLFVFGNLFLALVDLPVCLFWPPNASLYGRNLSGEQQQQKKSLFFLRTIVLIIDK